MYEKILVPTDGSSGMSPVIDHATTLADVHGADLHALYVVNTASLNDLPMDSTWEGLRTALEDEGQEGLKQFEERADKVQLETVMREGSPPSEIVEYAEAEECDVIVMGTHGRSGVNRLLLGSVAERVVRQASTPVLTMGVDEDE